MIELYNLTRPQLSEQVAAWGGAEVHAQRIWRYLYRDLVSNAAEMRELPARLLAQLVAETSLTNLVALHETLADHGATRKYLLRLRDGEQIEAVRMLYAKSSPTRATACLSSQVGCALGCVFCATGQLGFMRDLSTAEIVAQGVFVARSLRSQGIRLSNLVLMGMGEPLLNYEALMPALDILHDSGGFAIGAKQITISTVGVIPGIIRLADEGRRYSLAVSLHAAAQTERQAMIPAARPWPLEELMRACRYYTTKLQQKIFFEWTLIDGSNDSPDHARRLADLLQGIPAQVNLIPLNRTAGFPGEPGLPEAATQFRQVLRDQGIPCSIRQRRGTDIAAGCGQLAGIGQ